MTTVSKITRYFHWSSALLFLIVLITGLSFDYIEKGAFKGELFTWHKSLSIIVLVLAIARTIWRIKEGKIEPTRTLPAWQQKCATVLHHTLLLITIIMPLSGVLMTIGKGYPLNFFTINLIAAGEKTPWLSSLGGQIHHFLPNLIIALLALHILAAIKHQFIDKDNTLGRMLGR